MAGCFTGWRCSGNTVSASIITAWGWKSVFYIYGITGVIFAYLTWLIVRDSPAEHPRISKEELELIQSSIVKHDGAESVSAAGRSIRQLLLDPVGLGSQCFVLLCCLRLLGELRLASHIFREGKRIRPPEVWNFCESSLHYCRVWGTLNGVAVRSRWKSSELLAGCGFLHSNSVHCFCSHCTLN